MPNVPNTTPWHNTEKSPYRPNRAADVALFLVAWRAYQQWQKEPELFTFHTIAICFPDLSFREFLAAYRVADSDKPDHEIIEYVADVMRSDD